MTLPAFPSRLLPLLATLLVAWLAAQACVHLKTPLPWMIGPLLSTAALSMAGVPLQSSRRLRNGGQWIVGTVLGLYFTPAVAAQSLALAPWMLLGALWALLMGFLFGRWLLWSQPAGTVDATTTYFASVIGGASEMAAFAERVGARVDLVAAAQLSIGISLGTRFTPTFLHTAPRWLAATAVGTLVMIAASAGYSWLVAQAAGLVPATVLLGNSPGGIAEMCITAKVLDLGVAVVTGFHVVRYVIVLVLTGPIYARFVRPHPH